MDDKLNQQYDENDLPHGEWRFFEKGKKWLILTYKHGKLFGPCEEYSITKGGLLEKGSHLNGNKHGPWTEVLQSERWMHV